MHVGEETLKEGKTKWTELQYKTQRCDNMLIGGDSGCGMIEEITTAEEYSRFVFEAPRPYHLFVRMGCGGIRIGVSL
jgi:hypothetical protein